MHVDVSGPPGAPPLLLLHGGGVAGWMWDDLRLRLGNQHRILVPDLPGHGASSDDDYVSHERTVGLLAEVLAAEGRPAAVAGFSLGAQLTVLLAARHPDLVARALVVSAQARPLPFASATTALLRATAGLARREWFARLQARELFVPDELFADYFATSRAITPETLVAAVGDNLRFEPPSAWGSFPGPVGVMVGSRERPLLRDSASRLADAVPHARLTVVEGAGHGIPFQRPEWFAAEVDAWSREEPAAPRGSIVVRLARADDLPDVRAFGAAHIPDVYGPLLGREAALRQVEHWWTDAYLSPAIEAGLLVVAESGRGLEGVAQLGNLGDDHIVFKLYVAPTSRGTGLGPRLLARVDELLPATATRLVVEHVAANERAAAFYEREGFAIERVEPHPSGDARQATVWRARARTAR